MPEGIYRKAMRPPGQFAKSTRPYRGDREGGKEGDYGK